MEANDIIAPFVLKTYQMVNDPSTDTLITWGHANNSFIVIEPLDFSQRILPAYFKHNNFSSFVRQLNTYGFRKVDPDRWEFANEWFLRGQNHLLKNIVRRKHCKNHKMELGMEDDEEIYTEIARLRQEQVALEEELQGMNKRLEATEKRPQQMLTFLRKVVEDPDLLPRMEQTRQQLLCDKKRRLMISSSSSSSGMAAAEAVTNSLNSVKSEEEEEGNPGVISGVEYLSTHLSPVMNQGGGWFGRVSSPTSPDTGFDEINRSGQIGYFGELATAAEGTPSPPYPFSLLGGGFY